MRSRSEFEHDPELYARSFADVYDEWYGSLDDPALLVASIAGRAKPGARVLELGSGTGRLAAPLHEAGFNVLALDASSSMLTSSPWGPQRIAADMAQLPIATASCDIVFIAYNTLFNLASIPLQHECFREAHRVLRPGGFFGVETFIAPVEVRSFGLSRREHPTDVSSKLVIVTGPDPTNPDVIVGSHIEHGDRIVCRPWRLTYQSPTQLDVGADSVGLRLHERWADWAHATFSPEDPRHVSWYTTA